MPKKKPIPNLEQELEIKDIILARGSIHKNVESYLKKNNLRIASRDGSYSVKKLIWSLIDKYKLNESIHIDKYNSNKPLTQTEFDVIVGGLLGDSYIGYQKNSTNPSGSFTHKLEHKEYVEYKYNLIKRLCSKPIIVNKCDKRSNRHYQQVTCRICSSKLFIPIQSAFYKDKIKIISEEFINKLTALGIAIWFMDDGSSDSHGYKFSVDCFCEEDIKKLTKMLTDNFGLHCTYNINQNKTIHICRDSVEKFKNLVEPYMCECMKYKLQIYEYVGKKPILVNV